MLSIGKLAAGQAKYYLDQAQARVDVAQSVCTGVEDYYVGPGEARGPLKKGNAPGGRAPPAASPARPPTTRGRTARARCA